MSRRFMENRSGFAWLIGRAALFPPYRHRPVLVFLVVSIGFHLFALGLYTPRGSARPATWRDIPLQWVDPEPAPVRAGPPGRMSTASENAHPEAKPAGERVAASSTAAPLEKTMPTTTMPTPDGSGAVRDAAAPSTQVPFSEHATARRLPSTAELLEQARDIARAPPSRAIPRVPPDRGEDDAILPRLDRALRREAPGERHYVDGLIKMVTPSGRVYCLKPPPEFARGGPTEALAVPTNCP